MALLTIFLTISTLGFATIVLWIALLCRRLRPLLKPASKTCLDFSPLSLKLSEIALVLLLFAGRSLEHAVKRSYSSRNAVQGNANEAFLSMPLKITKSDLDAYLFAVHGKEADVLQWNEVQLTLLLSALSEPAMLLLLATRNCEVRPLGAVNVRNRFELLRPDLCHPQRLVTYKEMLLEAAVSKSKRLVKRGLEIDLSVSINVFDTVGGGSTAVYRQIFTMLQFADTSPDIPTNISSAGKDQRTTALPIKSTFSMHSREPAAWAKVCKDYNPIHISGIAARMFGFPDKIAHGNHVVAKAFASDVVSLEDNTLSMSQPLWMEVSFKRPVTVPAKLEFGLQLSTDSSNQKGEPKISTFEIASKGKIRVSGSMGSLRSTPVAAD